MATALMNMLGIDSFCCLKTSDAHVVMEALARERFEDLCGDDDALPLGKLGDLLARLFDHAFDDDECDRLASRTASHAAVMRARKESRDAGRGAPDPRLTWDECEYIMNLCEQDYPYLNAEREKKKLDGEHEGKGDARAEAVAVAAMRASL